MVVVARVRCRWCLLVRLGVCGGGGGDCGCWLCGRGAILEIGSLVVVVVVVEREEEKEEEKEEEEMRCSFLCWWGAWLLIW